jgi:hypothetical protein
VVLWMPTSIRKVQDFGPVFLTVPTNYVLKGVDKKLMHIWGFLEHKISLT